MRIAFKLMLCLIIVVIIFHVSIILKIIPYEIVWGGRLKNDSEMYLFETISIVINLFLCLTLLIKENYIRPLIPIKAVNIILWIFLIIFSFNTIGNLLSKTNFEKLFAIITLVSSVLIWIILKRNKELQSTSNNKTASYKNTQTN
jgi:hypothetical protein